MSRTPRTSREAYRRVVEAGEDVALRRKVAAALGMEPRTTNELGSVFPEHSANAIRPRVNELLRMRCVRRDGTRTNPSGHEAYVNHLTQLGERYVRGEVNPDVEPPLSEHRRRVVYFARLYLRGETDRDMLRLALDRHDSVKQRMEPDWDPEDAELP